MPLESFNRSKINAISANSDSKIKGIIFDFDGVLSSFQLRIGSSFISSALKVKQDISIEHISKATLSVFDYLSTIEVQPKTTYFIKMIFIMLKKLGFTNLQALKYLVVAGIIYSKNRKRIVPTKGVREVLKELLEQGYKVILLTNTSKGVIEVAKTIIPEINEFDLILTRDDIGVIKPNVKGFLRVLNKLGLKAEEVISVGDQASDIIASRRANIKSIAFFDKTMKFTKAHLIKHKPDFIISDFREIPELMRFLRDCIIEDIRTTIDLTEKSIQDYALENGISCHPIL